MKWPWCIALAVFLVPAGVFAQAPLPEASPLDVGMSATVLKEGVALFAKAIAEDELRGAVLLVARRGKVVLHQTLGWRDKDQQLPMQADTLFHVASNTKPITASAVLMLVEEGKLDLDADVGRYLPAFDNDRCKGMKIRHLLSHTSGLRIPTIFLNPLLEKSAEHPDAPNLRLEVDRFAAIGPKEPPGTSYSYNNPGYNTLGALIEVASGQPLAKFLKNRIYTPLGMKDAYHMDNQDMVGRRATVYSKKDGQWTVTYRPGDPPKYPFVRASGGLITTAKDYARFLQMYLDGGTANGQRLLKTESVHLAVMPHSRAVCSAEELKTRTSFYGFGWTVSTATGIYSHGGSDGTFAWVDPKNEVIGIVFTQSPGGRNPRDEFIKLVRQSVGSGN